MIKKWIRSMKAAFSRKTKAGSDDCAPFTAASSGFSQNPPIRMLTFTKCGPGVRLPFPHK